MALTASVARDLYAPGPPSEVYDAAVSIQFYQGSIVAIQTTTGKLVKGTASTTLKVVGVAAKELNTTGLTGDDLCIAVDHGTFGDFTSAGGADLIEADDIKKLCYVVDDDTVALTDGGGTRSVAGTIHKVLSDGLVVVQFEVVR